MIKKTKPVFKMEQHKLSRFTEVSMVSLIIASILGAGLKGMHLIEDTKLQSVAKEFQEIRLHVEEYMTRYGRFPGSKDAYETLDDTKIALCHMHEKGIIHSEEFIKSKLGGLFVFKTINGKHHLQLLSGAKPFTRRQIKQINHFLGLSNELSYTTDGNLFSFPLTE